MGIIQDNLTFEGKWRTYQQRVLNRAEEYRRDKRVHIVAAPGSGKTTLGIELIRRMDAPCLILAPSVTIRDQWIARIRDAFLKDENKADALLSTNIRKAKPITAITYQAMHCCLRHLMNDEEEAADAETTENQEEEAAQGTQKETSDFDFIAALKAMGVKTICLDEAHHLRSEWWKALEEMMGQLEGVTLISPTATPPYDSDAAEWQRYSSLCGPIDEEIIVPELVKEGSLCPHQDYVYFNMPTKEEEETILKFRQAAEETASAILADTEFASTIASHKGLADPDGHAEELLEDPAYFSSLLIFLQYKKIPFPKQLKELLGTEEQLPQLNLKWLEILLQGFLYEDMESFVCSVEYREAVEALLKSNGLIQKRKVTLQENDAVCKALLSSSGKIDSIIEIVGAEYQNLGSELRLLVLADYIKKEYLSAIGTPSKNVSELGVVPIFESIRRGVEQSEKLRIGVLSGTVVIIPEAAKEPLQINAMTQGIDISLKQIPLEKNGVGEDAANKAEEEGYYQVTVHGSGRTAAGLVTELFNAGFIRVLVGTKSLLGEGWDSPSINTLILASFVGSFMLSNQMRGRAIRTMKGNPEKVSNVWHLVCMETASGIAAIGGAKGSEDSQDFQMLKRRFEGFMGVHYERNVIQNGLERLSLIKPPYKKENLDKINAGMLTMAANRPLLKKRWEESLVLAGKRVEAMQETGVAKEALKQGVMVTNGIGKMFMLILMAVAALVCVLAFWKGNVPAKIAGVLFFCCSLILFFKAGGISAGFTPLAYMRGIGKGILKALKEIGAVTTPGVRIAVQERDGYTDVIGLNGGSEREKEVFAQAVYEFFGQVDNQRYLLKAAKKVSPLCKYYCVPELFGKKKEDAFLFASAVSKQLGKYELVYTRNPEGRKILLDARVNSFANRNERAVSRNKKVKSSFE